MTTPREHFDRLVKAKKLLKADADDLKQLRSTRDERETEFKQSLQAFTDYMKDKKNAVIDGRAATLKDQLAQKDRNPKLALAVKVAKNEIDAYAKFCSGDAVAGLRRIKGDAKAFRKALQDLVDDTKKREKAHAADVDAYRQLLMAWSKVDEEFRAHLDDALDFPDKLAFDKSRALKKLESDFSSNVYEYVAEDEF